MLKKISLKSKIFCKITGVILVMAMVLSCAVTPVLTSAATVSDLSGGMLYDFSGKKVLIGSEQLIDGSNINVSDASTLEVQKEKRVAGWGWSIADEGGNKVLSNRKGGWKETWNTAGALRLNANNEFAILKPSQAYYVSFKYKAVSSQKTFEKNGKIYPGENTRSVLEIGYGATVGSNTNIGNRMGGLVTTVATPVSIGNDTDKFESVDENGNITVKNVGQWYTQEVYFTTPAVFPTYSQHFAICAKLYNGAQVYIDDIYIKEVPTVILELNGGYGVDVHHPALLGSEIKLPVPEREGFDFGGWYKDRYCSKAFTDKVYTEQNCNSRLFAKWTRKPYYFTADFCDYETGSEAEGDYRQNVLLNSNTYSADTVKFIPIKNSNDRKLILCEKKESVSSKNPIYFPLGDKDGNFILKSNTTYAVYLEYDIRSHMSDASFKFKIHAASKNNFADGKTEIAHLSGKPGGSAKYYTSFTTGNITAGKDAAYFEIASTSGNFKSMKISRIKLIQINSDMSFVRAYDSKEQKTYELLGKTGSKIHLPVLEEKSSIKFGGWYVDEERNEPYGDVFRNQKIAEIYSFWENKLIDFENFVPSLKKSRYTIGEDCVVAKDAQNSGNKILRYEYTPEANYYESTRHAMSLAFVYDKTPYKISFKYKVDEASDDIDIKFFTSHRNNQYTFITNYENATHTAYSKEAGKGWKQAVVYLTTDFVNINSNGLFISFVPKTLGKAVVNVDDVSVEKVKDGTGVIAFLGKDGKSTGIYAQGNIGTSAGVPDNTPYEYFASFNGWYNDKEFKNKFKTAKIGYGINFVYSDWTVPAEDFEGYIYEGNPAVVKDGKNTVLSGGEALLGKVKDNTTYLVTYKFKTQKAGAGVYFKTADNIDSTKNVNAYREQGEALQISSALADNAWHTAKRYINTCFTYTKTANGDVLGDTLYAVADEGVIVDDIVLKESNVVYDRGNSVLNKEIADKNGSQAMRFYFAYPSVNGAKIKLDGSELTVIERGIAMKNEFSMSSVKTDKDGNKIVEPVKLSAAEEKQEGYYSKGIKYGFGNYWEYNLKKNENSLHAAYSDYPNNTKAFISKNRYAACPSVSSTGTDFINYIDISNGYLERSYATEHGEAVTKFRNDKTWGAREVLTLTDENGAAIRVKPNTAYNITFSYKAPVVFSGIELSVNAGLTESKRTGMPSGTATKDTVLNIGVPDYKNATDKSLKPDWRYSWRGTGSNICVVTAPSDKWQTVTYEINTSADMSGYLPILIMGINLGGANNGQVAQIEIKDITVNEKNVKAENKTVTVLGETSAGVLENGIITPDAMPKETKEGKYFAGWANHNGEYVLKDGLAYQTGEIIYSYYLKGLYKSDPRDISAKGYIKAKDADGNIFTFYSGENTSNVRDVKAVANEVTDKTVHTFSGANWNRYTVVHPKSMPYIYGRQIEFLTEYAAQKDVKLNSVKDNEEERTREIIIGDTVRDESKYLKIKNDSDYIITVIGEKVVIKGGSDIATAKAVEDFISLLEFKDSLGCGADLPDGFVINGKYEQSDNAYVLTFNDDFDTLNTKVWQSYVGETQNNLDFYKNKSVFGGTIGNRSVGNDPVLTKKTRQTKKLVDVRDGKLVLGTAWVEPVDETEKRLNVDFIHSNVSTFFTMAYTYGMLEIRSNVGVVPGCTSLWINSPSNVGGNELNGCMTEYDLIENYGRTNYFASAIHHWCDNIETGNLEHYNPDPEDLSGNSNQNYKPDPEEKDIYDNYHIYTFLWENDKLVFAFDGVKYWQYDIPEWYKESMADCLVLSVGMGNPYYGAKFNPDIHPDYSETLVDYVRIYQVADMGSKLIYKK